MKDRDQRALVRFRMNSSRIDNGESAARPTGYTTRPGAGFVVHGTSMWRRISYIPKIIRNGETLSVQHSQPYVRHHR